MTKTPVLAVQYRPPSPPSLHQTHGDPLSRLPVQIPSGEMLQIVSLDGKATVCRISPDGKHVLCNSNEFLLIYDLYSLQHVSTVPITHKPSDIACTADGLRAFLATPADGQLTVLHLNNGHVDMTYKAALGEVLQGDVIRALTVAPNDQYVLVRSDCHLVVHQRAQEQIVAHFVRPQQVRVLAVLLGSLCEGGSVGWLVGSLVGWLAGRLVGWWLVG